VKPGVVILTTVGQSFKWLAWLLPLPRQPGYFLVFFDKSDPGWN
jgi:hypothetical protein